MDVKLVVFLCALSFTCVYSEDSEFDGAPQGSCKLELSPGCDCRVYHFFCGQSDGNQPYYFKARQYCRQNYDGLVRLESAQEQNAVAGYIQANGLDSNDCIPGKGFWIGLDDKRSEGDFVWLDNTIRQGLCTSGYENWAKREPNNNTKKSALGQDCVQLWFRGKRNGQWDDEYCNYRPKGAVCEQRVPHCNYADYDIDASTIPDCLMTSYME